MVTALTLPCQVIFALWSNKYVCDAVQVLFIMRNVICKCGILINNVLTFLEVLVQLRMWVYVQDCSTHFHTVISLYYTDISSFLLISVLLSWVELDLFEIMWQLCFYEVGSSPHTNPQLGGTGCPFYSGSLSLNCLVQEALPATTLPPAYLSGSLDYASTTTSKQGYLQQGNINSELVKWSHMLIVSNFHCRIFLFILYVAFESF